MAVLSPFFFTPQFDLQKDHMKYLHIFLFALISLFLVTCKEEPVCEIGDTNAGIIVRNANITCKPLRDNIIVDSDSMYQVLFGGACADHGIDFDTYTLLGAYHTGQCNVKFMREVKSIDAENRYEYTVTATHCGRCSSDGLSYNLVLVPKLPSGWTVSIVRKNI